MVRYIYWHKVILIDREVIRNCKIKGFSINQIVGFLQKEKEFGILNKECTQIEPYIKFKYLGRTIDTGFPKDNKKLFDKFMEGLK